MKKTITIAKRCLFLALAVVLTFGMFACEKKGEFGTGELEEEYEPNVTGKVKVTCRNDVYPTDSSKRAINNWVNAFKAKNSGVKIDVEYIDQSLYAPQISSKTMGDVFWLDDGSVYEYAVTNESLMALDWYIEKMKIDTKDVYEGIRALGEINGHTYFVGMSCGQQTFTYNVDALTTAGVLETGERIANDWTWQDFKDIAAKVTAYDEDGYTLIQNAAYVPLYWAPYYTPFFYAYGGRWCDTENKKINLYDEKVRLGIAEIIECLDNDWIYPQMIEMGAEKAGKFENIKNNPITSVFAFNTAYTNLANRGKEYDQNGTTWDIATFPTFEYAASPCGTIGFGVFSYAKNKDAAAALVLSLYTEDGQMAIHSQEGGDVPILKKLGDQDFWHLDIEGWEDKNFAAFTANYEKYVPSHVKASVPPAIAEIIENGMIDLFSTYCQNGGQWEDKLMEIQTQCNEKWETLAK